MWMVFASLTEAQAYCDAATASLPHAPGDVTAVWDTPRELTIGQWVVMATSDGVQWQPDWTLVEAPQ